MGEFDFDEKDVENVNLARVRSQSARKRKDSYDYVDTVQLLGEERLYITFIKQCRVLLDRHPPYNTYDLMYISEAYLIDIDKENGRRCEIILCGIICAQL